MVDNLYSVFHVGNPIIKTQSVVNIIFKAKLNNNLIIPQ